MRPGERGQHLITSCRLLYGKPGWERIQDRHMGDANAVSYHSTFRAPGFLNAARTDPRKCVVPRRADWYQHQLTHPWQRSDETEDGP